jgi:radical SAM superfamily enzyme YgiQ (UPF0313 family)
MTDNINYLVVNAPNIPQNSSSVLIEPVDVLTLATWIQHNHNKVSFVDLDRFGIGALDKLTSRYKIALVSFDYLIPLYSSEAIKCFDNLFSVISEKTDYILLVGRLATYFPREILNKFSILYGCVIGEPEIVLADLFKHKNLRLLKNNANIVTRKNQLNNNFRLSFRASGENIYNLFPVSGPIADRRLCEFHKYIDVHSIISSRGCSGCCKFCGTPGFLGAWKTASPQLILSEIKHLVSLGAHKIIFLDDNFSANRNRIKEVCKLIKENKINVIWGCLCRIVDTDESLLAEMHDAGCRWIHFGIEHGDYNIRRNLGKNFSNEQAVKLIRFAQKIGIRVRTSWILDLPEATGVSIKKTFELAREISSYEIKFHFLALRPGSQYYDSQSEIQEFDMEGSLNEVSVHKGKPHNICSEELKKEITKQLNNFRKEMEPLGYRWISKVASWKEFDNYEVLPDAKFLSCNVMKYGLGWKN